MSLDYDQYLHEHIEYVNQGLRWMADNLKINGVTERDISDAIWKAADHDKSKYDDAEYDAYDAYFYGGNRSHQVAQDFNRAWLHHIHQNPHHWQHWVLIEDDPEEDDQSENDKKKNYPNNILPLEMPIPDVLEMVADWWAFSWKDGNLFEIFNWYADHEDTQFLHKNTRKLVEDILNAIQDVLEEKKETAETINESDILEEPSEKVVKHYGIEGMHWGERRFQYQDGSLTPEGRRRYSDGETGMVRRKENKPDGQANRSKPTESQRAPAFSYVGGGSGDDGYEKWENDLYAALMKSGNAIDISNMSDADFAKLLSQYGIAAQHISPNLISQMKQKAITNYTAYVKAHPQPVKEETATPETDNKSSKGGSSGGSKSKSNEEEKSSKKKEETEKEKKAKEEAAKKAEEEKKKQEEEAKKAAEEEKKKQEEAEAEKNKPVTIEELEKNIYDQLKYSRYLSEGSFTVTELINDTTDGFKKKLSSLTGRNTSELKDSEVEDLRKKISSNYGLDTWENDISENMDMVMNKYPNILGSRTSFMRALMDYTKLDLSILNDSEFKKMQQRFAELYLDEKEGSIKHSDTDEDDESQKYGLPEVKKFPMPDAKHVRSAIKFFNYATPSQEETLAKAILARMEEYGMSFDDFEVGEDNRFKNYIPKRDKESQ